MKSLMFRNKRLLSRLQSRALFNTFTSPDSKFLHISGADTKKFLQGLCTNDVNLLKKRGDSIATVFLNTKGRIVGDAIIFDNTSLSGSSSEESVILEVSQTVSDSLLKHLKMYKLRSKVNFSFLTMKSIIESSPSTTTLINGDPKEFPLCTNDPRSPFFGQKVLVQAESNSNTDITDVDRLSYTRYRLLRGLPEGAELVNTIPLEINLDFLHYISFTKGCYIGQELVARTYFKGQIRKRLVPFLIDKHPQTKRVLDNATNMRESFFKLTEDQIDTIENQTLSTATTASASSTIQRHKIFTASTSAISVSPGSGSGCSGHGRWNGGDDGAVLDTVENVETSHEEVGDVVSMNTSLGLGLALVRLTALYPISTASDYSVTDGSDSSINSSTSSSHKSFYVDISESANSENTAETTQSSSSSSLSIKKLPIVLFQPLWWPSDLDPLTGKLKV